MTWLPALQKIVENTKPVFYSEHEIAMWMENEGLDYLVQSYMLPDHIESNGLRAAFIKAKEALDFIDGRLSRHLVEDQDYDDPEHCVLDK